MREDDPAEPDECNPRLVRSTLRFSCRSADGRQTGSEHADAFASAVGIFTVGSFLSRNIEQHPYAVCVPHPAGLR